MTLLSTLGVGNGRNILSGGLTLAVLVLPLVIITSTEAIRAVPLAIREAGYGIGASRWQVVRQLVLPVRRPGHPDRDGPRLVAGARRDRTAHPGRRRARLVLERWRAGRPGRWLVHGPADHRVRLGAQAAGGVPGADLGGDHRPARRSPSSPTPWRSSCAAGTTADGDRTTGRYHALDTDPPDRSAARRHRSGRRARSPDPHREPPPLTATIRPPDRRPPGHDVAPVVRLDGVSCYYGAFRAVKDVTIDDPDPPDHGAHRSVRLRQVDAAARDQPDERPHPGRPGRGHDPVPRRGPVRLVRRSGRGPAADRDGLPEAEPVPQVDLRQRRLRARG